MILPILYIDNSSKKGRGVFTFEDIETNTVIEISPVIVLIPQHRQIVEQTILHNYIFEWGDDCKSAAIGLGYISIYNHSYNANCIYEMDYEEKKMVIKTVKKVLAGEELQINYNAVHNDATPIWFEVTD